MAPLPDLNLLVTLDVLLAEGSVARAARRLRLSPSAMSRQLARLREATGDPLLVRAGRGLVPTPRALALRERIGPLVDEASAVLRPDERLDLARLQRTFTLRTRDGFVANFGAELVARVEQAAPGVRLRFVQKADRDGAPLREGRVDLETGVVTPGTSPELRTQALFQDRFVAVVRAGHPLLAGRSAGRVRVTAERYAAARHVGISRQSQHPGPIDGQLALLGLARDVVAQVEDWASALALARASDLVASVPERHTSRLREGLRSFPLPLELPPITVAMLWHPRQEADPAHRWLRGVVLQACAVRA